MRHGTRLKNVGTKDMVRRNCRHQIFEFQKFDSQKQKIIVALKLATDCMNLTSVECFVLCCRNSIWI